MSNGRPEIHVITVRDRKGRPLFVTSAGTGPVAAQLAVDLAKDRTGVVVQIRSWKQTGRTDKAHGGWIEQIGLPR